MSYHRYFCGCYHVTEAENLFAGHAQTYLPLLTSESHTSLISTGYRTKLKQIFNNPSAKDIKECIYNFPLYDGVALVSFTCHVGGRVLKGVVKEKNKAKAVYDQAVARGESAGLLQQLPESSDVFSTQLGNIPAGETVMVRIEYVGELKQEAETNGVRFTIPTNVAPRYGNVTSGSVAPSVGSSGIKIVVDVQMPAGSNIQGLQSPSHPIAVALGKVSTETPEAEMSLSKASASLSLDSTSLDKDFVLIVLAKDTAIPRAILETHPTIANQKALMVTLVPKFSLPPSRPEIVFVADRSGSMGGNIPILISAMKVFLKSLPVGVKFNICSFGSRHEFLWPKSKTYAQDTLAKAISYVERFDANFGGTETFSAIKATIEQRFTDVPLEVMLLTDGDIWQQEELFRYLNEQVDKSQGNIRVFPLGIGSGVSHALIEGVARAGNGFAQAVQDGEKLDNRVVRMLKGALSPHITDYTLEVKYEKEQAVGDDFELIEKFEKVTDGFTVSATEVQKGQKPKEQKPISLFDSEADPDGEDKTTSLENTSEDRYAHLPLITIPKLLQAPHKIPPLFPFTRASVYLLMTHIDGWSEPESVILRATSSQGPLELEIPVDILPETAETIHQLAAKKAVQDLEEGRGWIYEAKDEKGVFIKERYPSKFEDMVEREAVRLGTQFGIAGKWCSFVAVAENDSADGDEKMTGMSKENFFRHPCHNVRRRPADFTIPQGNAPRELKRSRLRERSAVYCQPWQSTKLTSFFGAGFGASQQRTLGVAHSLGAPRAPGGAPPAPGGSSPGQPRPVQTRSKKLGVFGGGGFGGGLFGSSRTDSASPMDSFSNSPPSGRMSNAFLQSARNPSSNSHHLSTVDGFFGSAPKAAMAFAPAPAPAPAPCAPPPQYSQQAQVRSFARKAAPRRISHYMSAGEKEECGTDDDEGFGGFDGVANYMKSAGDAPKSTDWTKASDEVKVHTLIALQDFEGFWEYVADMYGIMSLKGKDFKEKRTLRGKEEARIWTTVLVITFLEQKMKAEEGVWDLVVEKARAWLEGMKGERERETLEAEARAVFA